MIKRLLLIALVFCGGLVSAQSVHEVCDSVKIYFRQGKINLVPSLRSNQAALDRIADSLNTSYADSVYRLQKILVVGGASPEGSVRLNKWLSEKRAGVLFDYLSRYGALPDSLKTTRFLGRDWRGLIALLEDDPDVPYKDETLALLRDIADEVQGLRPAAGGDPLRRLQRLRGGKPYWYMYRKHFPELRAARLYLWYERVRNPLAPIPQYAAEFPPVPQVDTMIVNDAMFVHEPVLPKPFYMDIRTNMLYDVLAVPNIGAEFYLGAGWSVMANWVYGWWKTDRRHWYWRIYGGDVYIQDGTVNLQGGIIDNNLAAGGNGGGVFIRQGSLTVGGSTQITNNSCEIKKTDKPNSYAGGNGGGIYIYSKAANVDVDLQAGMIKGNTADRRGGGLCVIQDNPAYKANITLGTEGGLNTALDISENRALLQGGGVYAKGKGALITINSGTIMRNHVSQYAHNHDVTNEKGSVTLIGGEVAHNIVTFNANYVKSGNTEPETAIQKIVTETNSTLVTPVFTRTLYRFTGWNDRADGTGNNYVDGQIMNIYENITLYAQWEMVL